MATYSSVLAWRIPGTEEPGGLPSMGSHRDWSDLAATAAAAYARKVMLKILEARLQQYVNCELPDVQAHFRRGRGARDKIANICWIIKKAREFQKKTSISSYWLCQSLWLCGSPQTVENSERDWNTKPPDLPLEKCVCRSRRDRTRHGTMDWFKIGKGACHGCILSPCLFNLYAEYIKQNSGLYKAQAVLKIARRNINNLTYADDTTLMAENEEELKSLLIKRRVKKLA